MEVKTINEITEEEADGKGEKTNKIKKIKRVNGNDL